MAGPGGAVERERTKKRGGLGWLLAGVVLGVLGTIFLPDLAAPWLPDSLRGEAEHVSGVVEAKATGSDRLLLTVGSEAGATLVTFREEIEEIDLLVSVGDSVRLAVDEYAPFIDDARITRVMKPRDWRPAAAGPREGVADTAQDARDTTDTTDTTDTADTAGTTDTADTTGAGRDPADGAPRADTAPPAGTTTPDTAADPDAELPR